MRRVGSPLGRGLTVVSPWAVAALVLALGVGACGGDDDDGGSGSSNAASEPDSLKGQTVRLWIMPNGPDPKNDIDKLFEPFTAKTGIKVDTEIFRPATFIEESIDNLTTTLIIGSVLVILVIGAFLFEWRAALISLVAMPLSLVAAGLVAGSTGRHTWSHGTGPPSKGTTPTPTDTRCAPSA